MIEQLNTSFETNADRIAFVSINTVLGVFRKINGEMPVQQMLAFCWIALHEGGTQREMCDDLAMANSTASRNIAALS